MMQFVSELTINGREVGLKPTESMHLAILLTLHSNTILLRHLNTIVKETPNATEAPLDGVN